MSGMEIMLKSMGLGHVIEMAQQLANEGTLDKILRFADGLEELNGRLGRIENMLVELVGHDSDGHIIRAGNGQAELDPGSERFDGNGNAPVDRAGGAGSTGAD